MTNPDNVGGLREGLEKLTAGWVRLSNDKYIAHRDRVYIEGYDEALRRCAKDVRELCRAAPAGGDDLRLLVKELRETALRSVNLRDGQGMQDAYNDCADRLESAINELGVVRDNERQPQGTTSGGSPDYSRITPPDELCQKCHGTLEVLTNHAEPWSASAYSPCPDCHPAGKKGSAPAGSGEVEDWMVELFDEVYEREWNRAADEADDRHKAIIGPADRHATREAIAALLRKLQQGAE